jgi:predicted nucleic acid-binding protein
MLMTYDTSVLIAAFVDSHPHHQLALPWMQRVKTKEVVLGVSAHALAECYAILTTLPLIPKISPAIALNIIEQNIKPSCEIISLTSKDYFELLNDIAIKNLFGGITYDAITFKSAKKSKAKNLLTFNVKDFIRFCPDEPTYIISPL